MFTAIEDNVIEPVRGVQQLLDRRPYVTRLYSTLSAKDMTVDPLFTANPDLADVSNLHVADRIIECNPDIYDFQANWRIELPQGGVVRGRPQDVGSWPSEFDSQKPSARVLQMSSSGAGTLLEDNREAIGTQLVQYNASVMRAAPLDDSPARRACPWPRPPKCQPTAGS